MCKNLNENSDQSSSSSVFCLSCTVGSYQLVRWPSGLRRQLKALVRKGVGSNPTLIISFASTLFNYSSRSVNSIPHSLQFKTLSLCCIHEFSISRSFVNQKSASNFQTFKRRYFYRNSNRSTYMQVANSLSMTYKASVMLSSLFYLKTSNAKSSGTSSLKN